MYDCSYIYKIILKDYTNDNAVLMSHLYILCLPLRMRPFGFFTGKLVWL